MENMVVLDGDVQGVLEFMQRRIPARKLVGVAKAVSEMACVLWGHFDADEFRCIELRPVLMDDSRPAASESVPEQEHAGGDSGAARDSQPPM